MQPSPNPLTDYDLNEFGTTSNENISRIIVQFIQKWKNTFLPTDVNILNNILQIQGRTSPCQGLVQYVIFNLLPKVNIYYLL